MEKIGSKEVRMNASKAEPLNAEKKLSYKELSKACADLDNQNRNMQAYIEKVHEQLRQMSMSLQTKRMDYLFKVVEAANNKLTNGQYGFDSEFVQKCIEEIQESLTIPEDQEEGGKEA